MTTLDRRHVLVFGATGGLGSAVSAALVGEGASLTISARSEDRLREVAERLGPSVVAQVPADLRDAEAPAKVVEAARTAGGGLAGVVYAAGVVAFGGVDELDDDIFDELLLINLVAPVRVVRAAVPQLDADSFVLNLSAIVAEKPTAGMSAYSATKGALTAFDTAARIELRKRGIRVIDVRPPHTSTGLADRPIAGTAPKMGQGLEPDAVAGVVVSAIRENRSEVSAADFC